MFSGDVHVTPPLWLTCATMGAVWMMKCGPNTYRIQVTITSPSPQAVRTGWSGNTDVPCDPLPAETLTWVQCLPPSVECATSTSGRLNPAAPRVAK
jgi:hypothetical protein